MAEPSFPLTGGCGCGAVRFEISEPFASANYCHCTRCQRRTGTAASANGRTAPGSFQLLSGEEHLRAWAPEGGAEKVFCGLCGSAVFSRTRRRSARDRRASRIARRRSRHPAAVAAVRRVRRVLGGDPGRRPAALPRRPNVAPLKVHARSRAPSSSDFSGGRSRRRLRPGETAAPERESLALLPSGPDAVRMLSVRGTRPSTPRARDLIPLKPPSDGVRPRWSGFRVQGTANSPPSATGQTEGSTGAILC